MLGVRELRNLSVSAPHTQSPGPSTEAGTTSVARHVAMKVAKKHRADQHIAAEALKSVFCSSDAEVVVSADPNALVVCHAVLDRCQDREVPQNSIRVVLDTSSI